MSDFILASRLCVHDMQSGRCESAECEGEQVNGAELRGVNYKWDGEYIGVRAQLRRSS
jgi:hypothetical protein